MAFPRIAIFTRHVPVIMATVLLLAFHMAAFSQNKSACYSFRIDDKPTPLEQARGSAQSNRIVAVDHLKTYQEYEQHNGKLVLLTNRLYNDKGYCTRETYYTSKQKLLYHYKLIGHDSIHEVLTYLITHLQNKKLKRPDTVQVKYGLDTVQLQKSLKQQRYIDSLQNIYPPVRPKEDSIQFGSLKIKKNSYPATAGNPKTSTYFISHNKTDSAYPCYGVRDEMMLSLYDAGFTRYIYNTCLRANEVYYYHPNVNDNNILMGYDLDRREIEYINKDSCKVSEVQNFSDHVPFHPTHFEKPYSGFKTITGPGYYEEIQYSRFDKTDSRIVIISTYYE